MMLNEHKNPNPTSSSFKIPFEDTMGYDLASYFINDNHYHGYFEKSPIEYRLVAKFNYSPIEDESQKPYKAQWMIYESKLLLGYVNGVINGTIFYTNDIVPEFPDDEILYHYLEYNGSLKFCIQGKEISSETKNEIISCNFLELTFKDGVLMKVDGVT